MNDIRLGLPSASSAQADVLCPGRPNAQRGLPEWQSNEYASFGTLVHAAYEGDDMAKLQLSSEQTDILRRAVIVEKFVFEQWATGKPVKRYRENRLWDYNPDGSERNSGQYDVAYFEEVRALIGDLKSLYGDIPSAPKNRQLRELAALVFINREKLGYPKLKEVSVFINQPLATMKPVVAKYGKADLERAVEEMRARVDKNMDPDAPRIAGAYQCKMCRAKLSCPKAIEYVNRLRDVNVLKLDPVQLADMLDRFELNGKMEEEAKEYAKLLLTNVPGSVPGYELRDGSKVSKITNFRGAADTLIATGFTKEQVDEVSSLSIGDVANAWYVKHGGTKKAAEDDVKETLKPFITETQNQPMLKKVKE